MITLGGTVSSYTLASAQIVYSELRPVEQISITFSTSANGEFPTFGTRFLVDDVSFNGTLGIDEQEHSLSVFPNPAHSEFVIEGLQDGEQFSVFSLNGEKMDLVINEAGKLNCSSWSNGVYLLNITNENGSYTQKLIVSH